MLMKEGKEQGEAAMAVFLHQVWF